MEFPSSIPQEPTLIAKRSWDMHLKEFPEIPTILQPRRLQRMEMTLKRILRLHFPFSRQIMWIYTSSIILPSVQREETEVASMKLWRRQRGKERSGILALQPIGWELQRRPLSLGSMKHCSFPSPISAERRRWNWWRCAERGVWAS